MREGLFARVNEIDPTQHPEGTDR